LVAGKTFSTIYTQITMIPSIKQNIGDNP